MTDDKATEIGKTTRGITKKTVVRFQKMARNANPGFPPDDLLVDHTKAANPCESLHGENWKEEIKKAVQ